MKKFRKIQDRTFAKNTVRKVLGERGGGIEIKLDTFGYKGQKMTAYQNYLGGGMLGSIANDCTVCDWEEDNYLVHISEGLSQYFGALQGFTKEQFNYNQTLPVSAY